ncbi:glycoside hydrolase family protein [Mangrovibacterium sp.]|uniref:glycoside hydrolase family protein n=1 Tax=Mangrovibacterium sp. TaxID=1961364 RepID=UPI00356A09B9
MNEKLEKMLIEDEGLRLMPYRCTANKLTIGVGRNIEERGITEEEAMFLLRNDIYIVMKELGSRLSWFTSAPETVQLVLANMCFNMGASRLMQFKKTLEHLEKGEYLSASLEMLNSKWAVQVGKRAARLSKLIKDLA